MRTWLAGILLIGILAAVAGPEPAAAAAKDETPKTEVEPLFEDVDEILLDEMEQAEKGDNKEFTVVTDNNTVALQVGDVYKNHKSYYKVARILEQDEDGGEFVVQRFKGTDDPGKTWSRVSGSGPITIASRETLLDRFLSGGFLMYPIAALLLGTIVIMLNSLWVYRRDKQIPPGFVAEARSAVAEGDLKKFEDLALREKGLFGILCRAMAVDFRASTIDDIRNRCEVQGSRQFDLLRVPLRALNFIAAVAPLLGLLGTVIGMIVCFEALEGSEASVGKAQAMARGIKMALLTTAAGLSVAVPTLLVYFVFNTRLSLLASECGSRAEELIHGLAAVKRTAARARADVPAADSAGEETGQ